MCNNWIEKTDSNGNKIMIRPKAVYILELPFDVEEHKGYLYRVNVVGELISA